MDIFFLFKVAAIGLIVAVLYQVLARSGRDEYAMLTALTGIGVIIAMLIPQITGLFDSLKSFFDL